jgi:membrane fusion protein, multidrug efflux system
MLWESPQNGFDFATSMFPAPSRSRGLFIAAVVLIVALSIPFWRSQAQDSASKPAGSSSAIPVTVAEVEQRDVPHRISGIGTVQSLHSVVIRPQVTGVITEVLFKEGELVERGTVLARIDDRTIEATLAQAQAERASKEAQLRVAELDLTRYDNLAGQKVVSRQTLEKQAALVEELKAGIRASDATLAAQRVQLSFTRIVSPVRGRVGIRRIDPGNLVQAGDANGIVTVTQMDPISIVFTLPQEALARLHTTWKGSDAARVTALERDDGTTLAHGQLTTFDNQIDTATGTLRLRAQFANADGKLWPGQFVALHLETGLTANALVVPARAVQQGLSGAFVYRIRESRAEVTPVITTYQDDEIAVIAKGVQPGDSIVLDGQSRLKAGATVKISTPGADTHAAGS